MQSVYRQHAYLYNSDLLDEVIRLIAKGEQQQKLIDDYDDHELGGD